MGPGVVAEAEELSQREGEGELGQQALVQALVRVVEVPAVFWLVSGGLAAKEWDSLVPA